MKNLLALLSEDYKDEHFTRFEFMLYGILYPVGLIAVMCLAGWLETLMG